MLIGCIGDVHLGANYTNGVKDHRTGRNTRLIDYERTLESTINMMVDAGVSSIVFTGDIFEHRIPKVVYQKMFSRQLRMAIEAGISSIHVVVGNHDQQRQSNATTISYLKELNLPNIVVYDELEMVKFEEKGVVVANMLMFPYRDRKWLEVETYAEAISKLDDQVKSLIRSVDNDAPIYSVGHMALEGTFFGDAGEQTSENELMLPKEMFRGIDITIMGHVHTPFVVSEDPYVAYVGSMEKRSASEKHDKKYAIINSRVNKVKFFTEPCREIYEIKGDFSDKSWGKGLSNKINNLIDSFAKEHDLEDSITKVTISIAAEDSRFCDIGNIERIIRERYKAYHCPPIKPQLFFSRQARDEKINENASDTEAFERHVKNVIDDEKLAKRVILAGLDIINGKDLE